MEAEEEVKGETLEQELKRKAATKIRKGGKKQTA
jgi:hypothetical protein